MGRKRTVENAEEARGRAQLSAAGGSIESISLHFTNVTHRFVPPPTAMDRPQRSWWLRFLDRVRAYSACAA